MSEVTCAAHKTFGRGFSNEVQTVKLTWNFATDGGLAADTFKMGTTDGKILVLVSMIHIEAACTGASGTAIIGIKSGDTDAFMDITDGAVANLVDDFCAKDTTGQGIVLDSGAVVLLDIATTNFTTGKINVFLTYVNID